MSAIRVCLRSRACWGASVVGEHGGAHCGDEHSLTGMDSISRGNLGARYVVQWREEGHVGLMARLRGLSRLPVSMPKWAAAAA